MPSGNNYQPVSYDQAVIKLELTDSDKASLDDILDLKIANMQGNEIPVRDFVTVTRGIKQKNIYRKNQKEAVYILADMAGQVRKSFLCNFKYFRLFEKHQAPRGFSLKEECSHQPEMQDNYSLKWDGEWQITFEVFRDPGIAFAVVILLI